VLLFSLMLPVVLYIQRRVVLTAVEEAGFRIADIFARSSVQAVLSDDYLVMQHVVNGIASTRKVRYAMLLKDDGEVLVHTRAIERGQRYDDPASRAAAAARAPLLQQAVDAEGGHIYDFTVPVYVLDQKRASARVGLSIEHELREIARTRNSLLGFGLAVIALGLAWATYQSRRLTEPVRALVQGTEEIARGNLGHRIAVDASDELSQLAQAFNRMTASVQAVVETSREISAVLDLEVVLRSIAVHAQRLVKADMVFIAPHEEDAGGARVRVVLGGRKRRYDVVVKPGLGMGGWVLANGRPFLTDHYLTDPRIVHDPIYDRSTRDEGIVSALALPIMLKGEIIGLLGVTNRRPVAFTDQDVDTLQRLAQQAAIAIANARLYAETKLKTARLEALIRVSRVMTSTLEPERIAAVITEAMSDVAPDIVVRVWATPDDAKVWVPLGLPRATGGSAEVADALTLPAGAGLIGAVASGRAPLIVEDVRRDARVVRRTALEREGLVSFLGLPLLREEKLLGVLAVLTRTRHHFSEDEVSLMASLAQQAAIALENARLYQDLRQSHHDLVSAQAELVRKTRLAAMGEIAAAVAHEARNPLGALSNCVQLLRDNPNITGEDAELLAIMQSESKRLNDIVSDFLTFGRPRAPQFAPVDLHELIDATWTLLQRDDRCPSTIRFERRLEGTVTVTADRDQLRQVFWNLLLNAVQAMRLGGTLTVETRRAGRFVEVLVRDTGPGIPAGILPSVFEPFVTTKSGGTGLGLAIVRRIIEDHGGDITVTAQDGEGTCFVLSLLDTRVA
jgi:signal transduction histidine kinase